MNAKPDVTIVFDTETDEGPHRIVLTDALSAWAAQTSADRVAEWIFVSHREPTPEENAPLAGRPYRWIVRPGLRYYQQKNAGVAESRTPYAAFADSDVVPEREWLERALATLDSAPDSVAAVTGRSRFLPGPFAREVALAQWPHLRSRAGEAEQVLAHNLLVRGDLVRGFPFSQEQVRHGGEGGLVSDLRHAGFRILYDPSLRVTHNYANRIGEVWRHCVALGWIHATYEAAEGRRRDDALRNGIGRYRVLARRLRERGAEHGILRRRWPLSLAFYAWYCVALGVGYARALRGEPEPASPF